MPPLPCKDPDLRDLSVGEPELHDSRLGTRTGVRLCRSLGVGGMSSVFLAKSDAKQRGDSPYPERLAVKIVKPAVVDDLALEGIDARGLADREATVLGKLTARQPPTDVIVGFFGQGDVMVELNGKVLELPWLALELVDGGPDGSSLAQRVARAPGGCDPVRVHRLARRIAEGVSILHGEGVIHRDLKPENVLVTGPVGDETPKIADCGIARYEGATSTLPAFTREYAAPEQWLSRAGKSNPLIGPWTDVHALAAVIWFLIAGEGWCRGSGDNAFLMHGARRSLREGARMHPGFAGERTALDALDAALARGASPLLPEHLHAAAPTLAPKNTPWRCSSVEDLMELVLPLLDDVESRWRARAAREGLASTVLRTAPATEEAMTVEPLAEIITLPRVTPAEGPLPPLEPGNVAFQSDGRALACFGDRIYHLWEGRHTPVSLPPDQAAVLAETKHVVRLPFGGFALVGPSHIRLLRQGRIVHAPLPARPDGRPVGPIVAAFGEAYAFGVVTADVGEGGPELWLFGSSLWGEPIALPGLDRVSAVASSPYGFLTVGQARAGAWAYAVFASEFGHVSVYMRGLRDKPPLDAALASADRVSWTAGDGCVLALDRGTVTLEEVAAPGRPVAMGLDPLGIPWLVTAGAVMRRSTHGEKAPAWRLYHEQDPGEPSLVGIGFSANGARVVDAQGGGALLRPLDVDAWQSR